MPASAAPQFELTEAVAILARTPETLRTLLQGLPEPWLTADEGPDTFSPLDVLGHLLHGERADWIARATVILDHGTARAFEPFDRFGHRRESAGRSMAELLDEFERLRAANLETLRALALTDDDLARQGRHPDLGTVTLRELVATWVVHDLSHLAQIARVMAKRYRGVVGPWHAYLPILER